MPAWAEYKAAARERGNLALELFVVESTPQVAGPALQETLPDHLAYQNEMEAAGNLVFAGPLSDETGEMMNGAGLIVYRAESFEAAKKIADADPMHATGKRSYSLRRWLVNEGSFTVSVALSDQTVDFS